MTAARTALMRLLNQVEPEYLAHHFGNGYEIDTIADTLLVVHRAQVRPEVLNEAADLIEAEQHRLDDAENAKHGYLDHETELQHTAVHAMGALLRRVAAGQPASGGQPLCNATNGTTICQRHPHTDDQHISPDGPNPTTASVWRDGSRSPAPMTVPWGPGWAALVADTAPNGETTQPADFFQAGRTYSHGQDGYKAPEQTLIFRVEHITRHPGKGHRRAIGWSRTGEPGARWHGDFRDEGEYTGWTETATTPEAEERGEA